jgi:hypothetical protein
MIIDRDTAAATIAALIRNELISIERDEKQIDILGEDEERFEESLVRGIEKTEERIHTLMLVAKELGMYEDVVWKFPIPQRLLEEFRRRD